MALAQTEYENPETQQAAPALTPEEQVALGLTPPPSTAPGPRPAPGPSAPAPAPASAPLAPAVSSSPAPTPATGAEPPAPSPGVAAPQPPPLPPPPPQLTGPTPEELSQVFSQAFTAQGAPTGERYTGGRSRIANPYRETRVGRRLVGTSRGSQQAGVSEGLTGGGIGQQDENMTTTLLRLLQEQEG